ncbi:uncharacterized protein LOC8284852 isoform X1 [Ricinus communis]|uniref:uncharacterized protein LOC8284852 isoform X1 n=1 Tax=Ricinus communis TaxID=3988 RepID=UPI00201AB3FC|nr:uncharacterized protein LOC8284852 isoform X1 [Ricinus communis]
MQLYSSLSSPQSLSVLYKSKSFNGDNKSAAAVSISPRFRASAADVPDFLSANWLESRRKRPFGPRLNFSAEEAVQHQLDALKYNDQPRPDYGIEVMYRGGDAILHEFLQNKGPSMPRPVLRSSKWHIDRKMNRKVKMTELDKTIHAGFAGFDPFERSTYFGPFFDLGQFERFRRIFHHSTYRVLLGHKERKILSSLMVKENWFKQRVWIRGNRPEEEEIFQFTMVQRVGGSWDGYWLTESLHHDGDAFAGGLAY